MSYFTNNMNLKTENDLDEMKKWNQETMDEGAKVDTSSLGSGAMGAAKAAAAGGNAMDIASQGLMMSKNPSLMAAGAGMAVLSGGQKRKQAQYDAEADAENRKRVNTANSLAAMAATFGKMRL